MVPADALRWSFVSTRLGSWISVHARCSELDSPRGAPEQFEGQPIASVQFEPEKQPLTFDQLMALLPLRVGQPLRTSDSGEAIQRLYQTGEYADIAVDASIAPAGVNLKFLTKPNYFIGHVDVTGVLIRPTKGQLLVATKLQLGAEYSSADVKTAVDRLADVVRRNGFYHASIEPNSQFAGSANRPS